MTLPRDIEPGDTVVTSARVLERRFLFRPDRRLTQAFRYILARYAQKYGIELHAACSMSTHLHLVMTDPEGQLPHFMRDVDASIANVVKARWKRDGQVLSQRPSVVRLLTPQSIADQIGYVQANPVAAGAVKYIRDWPGFVTTTADMGGPGTVVPRTELYFRRNGPMPDEAELKFVLPRKLVDAYGEQGARQAASEATRRHAENARKEVAKRGWKFAGRERCLRVSHLKKASAYEVWGKLNPTFATRGGGRGTYAEAVRLLRAFRAAYRQAWLAWKSGDKNVEFPYGTWAMRVYHGVNCAPAPG